MVRDVRIVRTPDEPSRFERMASRAGDVTGVAGVRAGKVAGTVGKSALSGLGQATGSAIVHLGKGLFNTQGRRPRILAHTSGIPPISRMPGAGVRPKSFNLEEMKAPMLRGRDISGRRE